MARQTGQPPSKEAARLSPEQKQEAVARLSKRLQELEALDPSSAEGNRDPKVIALSQALERTLVNIFGASSLDYERYKEICELGNVFMGLETPIATRQQYLAEDKAKAIAVIHGIIDGFKEDLEEFDLPSRERAKPLAPTVVPPHKIFVVHGHDQGAREAVARFLEKIGLEAIILQEQPDQGLTIIEKFETYASQVAFAVVLLTPDDLVSTVSANAQASRARQNVIFELGYFVGKLGRGRACLLRKGDVEIPSDLHGVIYTDMDVGEGWKVKLVKELKAAGLKFDANKVWE